jgi:hypothetical protein
MYALEVVAGIGLLFGKPVIAHLGINNYIFVVVWFLYYL